ncbi:hypothetical protein [Dactylosporangium sp. NPDC049140]|jgi:hypothetical protein|uniref:hypothetical protein n=1 Tax=Dactylosporangium sp. NPDC049140 TaxID=3155647 RepID=UPI0034093CB8
MPVTQRRAASALAGICLALTAAVVPATSAHASCPDNFCGTWGSIVADPYLSVRRTPDRSLNPIGRANHLDAVKITCWTLGEYIDQNAPWPSAIWDRIVDDNTGVAGYGADAWIQTSSDVRNLVPQC